MPRRRQGWGSGPVLPWPGLPHPRCGRGRGRRARAAADVPTSSRGLARETLSSGTRESAKARLTVTASPARSTAWTHARGEPGRRDFRSEMGEEITVVHAQEEPGRGDFRSGMGEEITAGAADVIDEGTRGGGWRSRGWPGAPGGVYGREISGAKGRARGRTVHGVDAYTPCL
jgi:hypothetical protein